MPVHAIAKHRPGRETYQNIGLALGPIVGILIYLLPVPDGLSIEAWRVVSMALWMACWWATEAIPVPATSLIPVIFLPLAGITTAREATTPYSSPVIYLLMGGFIIAMAMQRWHLHRRIALMILAKFGSKPEALILGFMIATALLSMWVSNTATTLMMVPIAMSVAESLSPDGKIRNPFTIGLLLAIAYSASIGGLGTVVGTPPNALLVAYLSENLGVEIGFAQWMGLGVPVVAVLIPSCWLLLTKVVYKEMPVNNSLGGEIIQQELADMGPISVPEKRTALMFLFVAGLWVFRPLLDNVPFLSGLNDSSIAIFGAVAMFFTPSGVKENGREFLLNWDWAVKIPWGVILLFGGGLSLASAVSSSGLAAYLGDSLVVLTTFHLFILMLAMVALIIFLTELTSNTATTAALLPVLGAIATKGNLDPILLAGPAAMAASCAFMLPVATAPNAVIFSGGQVSIPDMVGAGFKLNLIAIFLITCLCYMLVPIVFA